jgi:hypothetical protein
MRRLRGRVVAGRRRPRRSSSWRQPRSRSHRATRRGRHLGTCTLRDERPHGVARCRRPPKGGGGLGARVPARLSRLRLRSRTKEETTKPGLVEVSPAHALIARGLAVTLAPSLLAEAFAGTALRPIAGDAPNATSTPCCRPAADTDSPNPRSRRSPRPLPNCARRSDACGEVPVRPRQQGHGDARSPPRRRSRLRHSPPRVPRRRRRPRADLRSGALLLGVVAWSRSARHRQPRDRRLYDHVGVDPGLLFAAEVQHLPQQRIRA